MRYTWLLDHNGYKIEHRDSSWEAFIEYLHTVPEFPSKEDCQMVHLATFGNKKTPAGCFRSLDNLQTISGVEGD